MRYISLCYNVCHFLVSLFPFQNFLIDNSVQMLLHKTISYLQFLIVHNLFYASMVPCLCCSQTVLGLSNLSTIFLEKKLVLKKSKKYLNGELIMNYIE